MHVFCIWNYMYRTLLVNTYYAIYGNILYAFFIYEYNKH